MCALDISSDMRTVYHGVLSFYSEGRCIVYSELQSSAIRASASTHLKRTNFKCNFWHGTTGSEGIHGLRAGTDLHYFTSERFHW